MKRLLTIILCAFISITISAQENKPSGNTQNKDKKNTDTNVGVSNEGKDLEGQDNKKDNQEIKYTEGASGVRRSIHYKFNAINSDNDPGEGIFTFNDKDVSKVTWIYVDNNDLSGDDQSNWYSTWEKTTGATARGSISIVEYEGKNVVDFDFTGVYVDGSGYWKLPVIYVSGAMPANGATYYYIFNRIDHKKERADKERIEKERADKERADKERIEKERAEKERADRENQITEVVPVAQVPQPLQEPQPVVEPQPISVPQPVDELQPVAEPQPIVELQPVAEPQPVVVSQPVVEPQPAAEPQPVVEPQPAGVPQPIVEPQAVVEQQPLVEPQTLPELKPVQEPQPIQQPQPVQEPQPAQKTKPVRITPEDVPAEKNEPQENISEKRKNYIEDEISQGDKVKPVAKPEQPSRTAQPVQPSQTTKPEQTPTPSQPAPATQVAGPAQTKPASKPSQTTQTAPATQPTRTTQTTPTHQPTQTTQPSQPSQTTQSSQKTQPAQPVQNSNTIPSANYNYNNVTQGSRTNIYEKALLDGGRAHGKCYSGIIEVGYAWGIGEYGINNFRLNFINGFKIGKVASIGLGIGYRHYFDENETYTDRTLVSGNQMPVFLDLRTNFSTRRVTPYIAVGLGGSAALDKTGSKQQGLYFCPSGGIWFNLSDRFAIFGGVAYELQRLEYMLISDNSHFKKNTSSISLNIGISF